MRNISKSGLTLIAFMGLTLMGVPNLSSTVGPSILHSSEVAIDLPVPQPIKQENVNIQTGIDLPVPQPIKQGDARV